VIQAFLFWQKTEWFTIVCEVHVGKTLGLLLTLEWVHQLHLEPIDFELDANKLVAIVFHLHVKMLPSLK